MPQFEKVLNSLLRISNIDVYMIDDVLKILEYIKSKVKGKLLRGKIDYIRPAFDECYRQL